MKGLHLSWGRALWQLSRNGFGEKAAPSHKVVSRGAAVSGCGSDLARFCSSFSSSLLHKAPAQRSHQHSANQCLVRSGTASFMTRAPLLSDKNKEVKLQVQVSESSLNAQYELTYFHHLAILSKNYGPGKLTTEDGYSLEPVDYDPQGSGNYYYILDPKEKDFTIRFPRIDAKPVEFTFRLTDEEGLGRIVRHFNAIGFIPVDSNAQEKPILMSFAHIQPGVVYRLVPQTPLSAKSDVDRFQKILELWARQLLDGLEEATANAREEAVSSTKENVVGSNEQPNTPEPEVPPVTDQATTDGATEARPPTEAKKKGRSRGR